MDQFFQDILDSPFIEALSQLYSLPGNNISPGPFLGTTAFGIKGAAPKTPIADATIQSALELAIGEGTLPSASLDTCYFIFVPTDVTVLFDGHQSRVDFGGYHNSFQMKNGRSIFYAVITPSSEDEDELTENTSHELAEAVTDPIEGTGWIWEDPISGKLEEIADACFPDIATVHGYSISQFLASSPEPGRLLCAPLADQVPRGVSTSAAIEVDSALTRVTCLTGGVLEGQTAFFKVRAKYHDAPASLTSYSWFASSPDGGLVEPGGNQAPEFSVIVPFGMKTLLLRVEVTTSLGCQVEAVRSFTVFTQDQSDAERAACDSLARFREIAHIYHWPLPILLPGAPADAGVDSINVGVLNRLQTFGEAMVEFARAARPIARLVEARADRGRSREEPDSTRHRKRVRSRQAHR